MKNRNVVAVIISVIIVTILSGCTTYYTRGWSGSQYPGKFNASFQYFNGDKFSNIGVKEGETLKVNYNSSIEAGELTIKLYNSDKEVIAELETNTEGSKEFRADKGGKYKLEIVGEKAKGSFDISWKVQ